MPTACFRKQPHPLATVAGGSPLPPTFGEQPLPLAINPNPPSTPLGVGEIGNGGFDDELMESIYGSMDSESQGAVDSEGGTSLSNDPFYGYDFDQPWYDMQGNSYHPNEVFQMIQRGEDIMHLSRSPCSTPRNPEPSNSQRSTFEEGLARSQNNDQNPTPLGEGEVDQHGRKLQVGGKVKVVGLTGSSQYNGCFGWVVKYFLAKQRWQIRIRYNGDSQDMLFKAANLVVQSM